MNEAFSLIIVDAGNPDLPKYNRSVCGGTTSNLDQILLDVESDELVVAESCCARPHPGLVLVPVRARFDDGGLDLWKNSIKRLERVLARWVWFVQLDYFGSC